MEALAKKRKKKNINNIAYLFILPFAVVFLVFNVYPVLRTFYLSLTDYKGYGVPNIVWFDNYLRAFKDKYFWQSIWNTIRIWGVNIILQLGLAMLLTIVFNDIKYKMKGLSIFRALFYLPNLIAATSISFLFKTLLDWRFGTLNQVLMNIGLIHAPINWLGQPESAPYVVAVINAWMWFGNSFIMLMAGVQGIPKDYFEAAAIDGAGRWYTFRKITLPLLNPIMIYVFITSLIGGLQMFDMPHLISQGNAQIHDGVLQTTVMYLYKFGFTTFQVGYAGAIAYLLFLIILSVSILLRVINRKEL
jgi:multiple sugar transport system permease protein